MGLNMFFRKYDADRDGKINKDEFKIFMNRENPDLNEKDIEEAVFFILRISDSIIRNIIIFISIKKLILMEMALYHKKNI